MAPRLLLTVVGVCCVLTGLAAERQAWPAVYCDHAIIIAKCVLITFKETLHIIIFNVDNKPDTQSLVEDSGHAQ